jgi:hypothetical protein
MTYFTIAVTPPSSAKVKPGKEATFSFTVTSLAAPDKTEDVVLQATVVGEDGGKGKQVDWVKATPERASLTGGKTLTATIHAKPDVRTPKGTTRIQLLVAKERAQNDEYDTSEPVVCEVEAPEVKPPPPPPKWLIPVVAGAVVLVVGAAVTVLVVSRGGGTSGQGAPCKDTSPACDDKRLACEPKEKKCLLAGGQSCTKATDCASGECMESGACAGALGEDCQLAVAVGRQDGGSSLAPCAKGSVCNPGQKKCEGDVGAACRTNDQCSTGACDAGACWASVCTGNCAIGATCRLNEECASGFCRRGICAAYPPVGTPCTVGAGNEACPLRQKCVQVDTNDSVCRFTPGQPCQQHPQCSSQWCKDGYCSRDDGKCVLPTDCPSPYHCTGGVCLRAEGTPCDADAQCETHYCNPGNSVCTRCFSAAGGVCIGKISGSLVAQPAFSPKVFR